MALNESVAMSYSTWKPIQKLWLRKSCREARYHKILNILESDNLTNLKNRQEESEHKTKPQITTQSLNWFSYQTDVDAYFSCKDSGVSGCAIFFFLVDLSYYCTSWSLYCHSFIKRSPRDFPWPPIVITSNDLRSRGLSRQTGLVS